MIKKTIKLAIANLKGGVGKTTTTAALAYALGNKGYKVLVVDTDSQGNLTALFNLDPDKINNSIFEVMNGQKDINDCIIKNVEKNVDLLPSNQSVARLEMLLASKFRKELILEEKTKLLKEHYDFIIYDTAPAINNMTFNVLLVADEIIIPSEADVFSLKGINYMNDTIEEIKKVHTVNITGILLTRVERLSGDKVVMENAKILAHLLHTKIFKSYINAQKNVKESRIYSTNVIKYSEENRRKGYNDAGQDYEQFTDELLNDMEKKYGK